MTLMIKKILLWFIAYSMGSLVSCDSLKNTIIYLGGCILFFVLCDVWFVEKKKIPPMDD